MDNPKKVWEALAPLDFFKTYLAEWEHRGRDLYVSRCPNCRNVEFRCFDTNPVEWRCGKCHMEGFGVREFVNCVGENRLKDLKRMARDAKEQKALEAAGTPTEKIPRKLKQMEVERSTEERGYERMGETAGHREPLLGSGHPERVGPAIWVWLYLTDRMRGPYKDARGVEWGVVKPKSLSSPPFVTDMANVLGFSERSIRNHLNRLKYHGYIHILQVKEEIHVIDIAEWRENEK